MVVITSLKNSEKLAKKISKELKVKYIKTTVSTFPDGDLYLKFSQDLKNEKVIIVESFQPNSNSTLLNLYFAGKTAKDMKAKKVIIVSPYLGFMRQDKRFNEGEAINAPIMAEMISSCCDNFITVDPHLHRIPKMKDVFSNNAKNLTSNHVIAEYIKKKIKNSVVIGPDWESYQWADAISKEAGVEDTVFEKTRHSTRKVDVEMVKDVTIKGKNVIIVDDIISTGNTMIKALKEARKREAKKVIAVGVHGLFVENGLKKMQKAGFDQILTVNTIEHETNKIDISPEIIKELKKLI